MVAPNPDEEIKVRFTVENVDEAIKKAQDFTNNVNALKEQLKQLQQQSGQSLQAIAKGLSEVKQVEFEKEFGKLDTSHFKDFQKLLAPALKEATKEAKGLDTELQQKPRDVGAFSKALGSLGDVAKFVFVGVLGLSAIRALRELLGWFKQLTNEGYEFIKSMYKAGVAINALRFQGVNASIAQTVQWVKELRKEFGTLSEKEALDIISTTQLLTRNLGFTADKIKDVIRWSTALGVVQGKDVAETARQVVLFLSSGYGEGLQKAGIAVNRFVVAQKAMELGLGNSYMALTEQQRALAGYAVLEEQMGNIAKEATEYQKSLAGQIDKTTKEMQTLETEMGVRLVPLKKFWVDLQLAMVKAANWIVKGLAQICIWLDQAAIASYRFSSAFRGSFTEQINALEQEINDLKDFMKDFDLAEEMAKALPEGDLGPYKVEVEPVLDDQAARSVSEKIVDLMQEMSKRAQEIEGDLASELAKTDEELAAERENIWAQAAIDILQIQRDLAAEIAQIQADLQADIAEVYSDERDKLAEAQRKYRDNEWKAERDFQEKMRRLREGFLFDLEDALRERDAVQIMRLYRQYALDTAQTRRQYESDREERLRAYREELADIRRQADARIRELRAEAARKIAEAQAEAAKEIELRKAQAEQEAKDRAEANSQWLEDQLTQLGVYLTEEYKLNSDQVGDILALLKTSFGDGGTSEQIFGDFDTILNNSIDRAEVLSAKLDEVAAKAKEIAGTKTQLPQPGTETPPALPPELKDFFPEPTSTPAYASTLTVDTEFNPPVDQVQTDISDIQTQADTGATLPITTEVTPPVATVQSDLQSIQDQADAGATMTVTADVTPTVDAAQGSIQAVQNKAGEGATLTVQTEITPPVETTLSDLQTIQDKAIEGATLTVNTQVTPDADTIAASMEERRKVAKDEYDKMQKDFEAMLRERYSKLSKALNKEKQETKKQTSAMVQVLKKAFGQGGAAEKIYNYLIDLINRSVSAAQAAVDQLEQLAAQAASLAGQTGTGTAAPYKPMPTLYASGGYGSGLSMLGEKGYEFVLDHPTTVALERALGGNLTQESVLNAATGGVSGKMAVEVWLSPGLEAQIVEQALDQTAGIFDTVIRRR